MAKRRSRLDIAACGLLMAGLLVALSVLGHDTDDPPGSSAYPAAPAKNFLGPGGAWLAGMLQETLGIAVYVLLGSWLVLVVLLFLRRSLWKWSLRLLGWLILIPCAAAGADSLAARLPAFALAGGGGTLGAWLNGWLETRFHPLGGMAILGGCLFLGLVLTVDFVLLRLGRGLLAALLWVYAGMRTFSRWSRNWIKFTPAGGKVRIRTFEDATHVHLEIADNGQGIRADFLPHVFERFRQADSSTTRKHGGLGLGLAIVRHMVEIHGGSVLAYSEGEGRGAIFTVTLPLLSSDGLIGADAPETSSDQIQTQPELKGVHVLLVDDDAGAREMISAALNERQARVTAVASAQEALSEIKRARPDVLVSDIAMPVHDGYQLIEEVRALEVNQTKTIPAVAITAYAREEDRRRALAAGYQSYLPKPIEPRELIEIVAKLSMSRPHPIGEKSEPPAVAGG